MLKQPLSLKAVTSKSRVCVALCLLAVAGIAPACAEEADSGTGSAGRYQMTPAANGFLRLDTKTGAVSMCTISGSSAECRAAADDRAALMSEVDRLSQKNAELESRGTAAKPPIARLPDREDFGKALDMAEEFMRRMKRVLREDLDGDGKNRI